MPSALTVTVWVVVAVPVQPPLLKKLYVTVPVAAMTPCPPMVAVSCADAPDTSVFVQASPVPLSITVVLIDVAAVPTLKASHVPVEAA